jgi:hypothetical protein
MSLATATEIERTFQARIVKADAPMQIAYGVVLEPCGPDDTIDTQGDFYTAEDVELAAHGFMAAVAKADAWGDLMHDDVSQVGYPVESFIAPVQFQLGDQVVKAGSWVIGMHYPDPAIWDLVQKGELAAFSVAGSGKRVFA